MCVCVCALFSRPGVCTARVRYVQVSTNNTVGTWFGPPPKSTGKLRCAFVQHMGPNAVPRGVPHADMEGGRITKYAVERPQSSAL